MLYTRSTVHCEDQSKVETILKMFDLSAECVPHVSVSRKRADVPDHPTLSRYGPAVGMTRLDRWKRAAAWGLEPPEEVCLSTSCNLTDPDATSLQVYDILTTIEGEKENKYRESLFDGLI